ncbi:hypothetical protein GCWU000325_01380 [Alloprevotella tannerae ATCC 51259]|uniref:Uncharacterized protein n=1 Tax=Alloprevotella tannerae ATCC 51259 TaxID=626522 RepID=C9LGN6_9BACT|nr:hypothetical protein GCWU000325_01380 [Alloprevotella tannerae ATCC 51259]
MHNHSSRPLTFFITRKKVCARDKKGFTSREKRFALTSVNKRSRRAAVASWEQAD